MVKRCNHLLNRLNHDKQYQALLDAYHKVTTGSKEARAIGKQMNNYRVSIGLSKSGLESYIKVWQKQHSDHISKALYVKQSHCILANEVLEQADNVIVEHMDYRGLQRRSRNTERQDETTIIQNHKGKQQAIHIYKRKKRFGKSLGSRAPSEFLTILKQKLNAVGGQYNEVNTKTFKASQYNHSDDTYTKVTLNTRFKVVGGIEVQRDLYSAFLIQHSNSNLNSPDRQACIIDFETFVEMQNNEIKYLKASGQSKPECFGF